MSEIDTPRAVFRASVNGLKTIPSRKVVQITVECPIEELPRVAKICEHGAWLAVARLCDEQGGQDENSLTHEHESHPPSVGGARSWSDLTPAQQAGVLCGDVSFRKYLGERKRVNKLDNDQAAAIVRHVCGVASRRDIVPGTQAWNRWHSIVQDYRTWQIAPKVVG